jgi:hypothetical protein
LTNQKQGTEVISLLLHPSLAGVTLCCAIYQSQQLDPKCWVKTKEPIWQVLDFAVPFTSLSKLSQKCWVKTILLSQRGVL